MNRPLIYGELSREQVDQIINAPDFDEQMARAQRNMDAYMLQLQRAADAAIKQVLK